MRSWSFAIFIIVTFILTIHQHSFAGTDLIESNTPKLIIKAPLAEGKEALITVSEAETSSPEQIQEILRDSQTQKSDIIISTDQEKVIEAALEATSQPSDKRLIRFIPIGKLASASQKIASGFNAYYQRAKHTVMHDRIGLTVLTITVGFDTMIWIHASSFDIHQKTSMVVMNLVMAATFGLDRDLWSKMISPLKNKMINTFDRFLVNEKLTSIKVVSSQFLSNLVMGVGIQAVRTGLLSMDHISDAVITTDFWLTAVKISGLITLTTFAWTEMYGSIQMEKNPVAKLMLKRLAEMRGIILAQLASISMVLQPHVYGHTPIISFVVHGALGLIVLANADRIINFLETNALVNKVYKKVQTFENFINQGFQFKSRRKTILSCQSLFAT